MPSSVGWGMECHPYTGNDLTNLVTFLSGLDRKWRHIYIEFILGDNVDQFLFPNYEAPSNVPAADIDGEWI